jgi:hypothetical protein
MTLFMAISILAQLLGLILAPALIFLLGYYNVVVYVSLLNLLAIALYLLAKLLNKNKKVDNN